MEVTADPAISSSFVSQSAPVTGTDSPAEPRSQGGSALKQILQRIVEQTQPAPPPKVWSFLGTSESVRQLAGDESDLIAPLQTEFSVAQLLASRVMEQGPENAPRLSPVFGDRSASFVILRDATKAPTDVTSSRGLLSSSMPDWLRLAAEHADGISRMPQPVLLASDDDEMLLLRRLGCKFTSAAGLVRLTGKRVRELFAARAKQHEQRKYNLTLPCWQLAKCVDAPTPLMLRTLAHLAKIRSHFDYDPASIFDVWLPSAAEFRDIRSALEFADRRLIAEKLRTSLNHSRFSPTDALKMIGDRAKPDYGVARRQLQRFVESSRLVPRAGEEDVSLAKFERAFRTEVVAKFLAPVPNGGGWERWRLMMAAELAEVWFETLDLVIAARKILAGEYPSYRQTFDEGLLDEQLRMANAFAKLYRLKPPG